MKFEKIVYCSSEDPDFPAKNILTCEDAWKTADIGEQKATLIIQLDQKIKIDQLEIKNESSAFIEVLVANQSEGEDPKFQILLSASSFMTPNESKNLSNVNRLRVFTKDKLSPSALKESFDLVKINCTQPFNKTIKYGLAFFKIVESDAVVVDSQPSTTSDLNQSKRNQQRIQIPKKDSPEVSTSKPAQQNNQTKGKEKKTKTGLSFSQLMNNVTFTISGFQNPLRSEIRSKGLQMGAKYKGDWDRNCTHLICAFPNTPKYNQVLGTGGKIVTKEWIEDCYDKRKLLPWRKYSLDDGGKKAKKDDSQSDEDDDGEMDDFIVDDEEEDEAEPNVKNENDTDDDAVNELGPVLPKRLRDDSSQEPNPISTSRNSSPVKKEQNIVRKKPIKDEDCGSDDIYDAETDDE